MKLTFLGADREVTGSCTQLEAAGHRILIDCGMEQGKDTYENQPIPVAPGEIDGVLATHAHIDHTGLLPLLARNGFRGRIYATNPTVEGEATAMYIAKLLKRGKVNFFEAVYLLQPDKGTEAEQRIMKLVTQTPLSVPELVRCFENDVRDVSSADKVISAIYTEESDNQARLNNACSLSNHRQDVLEATANLYLTRQVILEHA